MTTRRTTPKSAGIYTSEFWLALAVILAATVLLVLDKIQAEQWMVAAGVNGAGYAIARGLAKVNPPKGGV